jgi:hypothetical protein
MENPLRLTRHGAATVGTDRFKWLNLRQQNSPSTKERHGALLLVFNLPSRRCVMRGAFADAFPTMSGTHDAPGQYRFSGSLLTIYFVD